MAELVNFRTPFWGSDFFRVLQKFNLSFISYFNFKKNNVPKKKITPFKEKCNVLTLMKEENRKMRYTIRSSVLLVKKDGRE